MIIDPSKVNSPESFVEFLAALLEEYAEDKERLADRASNVPTILDVTRFLAFLQLSMKAQCETKRTMPPSWETFARLLLITKRTCA
jgi:hypothetical protein